jgi:AraC family transcriptional regulator
MDVTIVEQPALRVAAIRHRGPYDQIGKAFGQLHGIASAAGLYGHPGAQMVALYHDNPRTTPADQLRSDAGITIPEGAAIPEGLTEQRVHAGRYARTVHAGGYETLPQTWRALIDEWMPQNSHQSRPGVDYEVYVNNPMQVPKDQLRTEIYAAIS